MNTGLDRALGYLDDHQKKELLRFVSVGSVDDGKSTLIGRLLHDTQGVYEDQLQAVRRASRQGGIEIDFSLFTDGLKAEREQGITIDVAYRYFATAKRKFIIADTPGHVQYTRNMATGASTADVAIILIDARQGVLPQSRRHAYIASLLGIPHLLVAVNKMDLRSYDPEVYQAITESFRAFAERLAFKDVTFVPISALNGDNVVTRSAAMPWFSGATVLEYLETVPIADDRNYEDFRFPVQYVMRPDLDYRAFAGEIASGVVAPGDTVMVLPSRKRSRVKAIDTFAGELAHAHTPMSVAIRLEDEIDISRGDMLVHPERLPEVTRDLEATVVWMSERPLDLGKSYLLKHTTQLVRAQVSAVLATVDLSTLNDAPAETLNLNDIGRLRLQSHRPLYLDPYRVNRGTGSFILIDSLTNNTVAAGMISRSSAKLPRPTERVYTTEVSPAERRERLGQRAAALWIAGEAALGQSLGYALERSLFDRGQLALILEQHLLESLSESQRADLLRAGLGAGLITVALGPALDAAGIERVQSRLGSEPLRVIRIHPPDVPAPTSRGEKALVLTADTVDSAAAELVSWLEAEGVVSST